MMVVSKDDDLLDEESLARVKLISDKKRQLEETADQVGSRYISYITHSCSICSASVLARCFRQDVSR